MGSLPPLPTYPSTQAIKGFSAPQLAHFHANLSNALAQVTALPQAKLDTPSTRAFISSYAGDGAQQTLKTLIWEDTKLQVDKHADHLRQRVFILAEKIASSPPGLELTTLLDLCVASPFRTSSLRSILSAAITGTPDLPATFSSEVVPAFTSLLSPSRSSGLYGLRKTVRCLTSLLRPSPPALVRPFAHNKEFIVTLAHAYDDGLASISRSYGGIRTSVTDRELDDWERIWLDTKVDIIDAFHLIVTTMVRDISAASGTQLAVEADRSFEISFTLLDITPQAAAAEPAEAIPFFNRSLVADYQHAYELSSTFSSALRPALREDARVDLLEAALRSLDMSSSGGNIKDPGALKLILRSSGSVRAASVNVPSSTQPLPSSANKGKAKAIPPPEPIPAHDADLDLQVTQVLDILPDHSPEYIRKLLTNSSFPFHGNAERVIEALLEGAAPEEDALGGEFDHVLPSAIPATEPDVLIERRNVFDEEAMDLTRIHIGKKRQDAEPLARDREEFERMKADVLRLAEAMSGSSDEESDMTTPDDDFDGTGATTIKILRDEEDSGDEEDGEGRVADSVKLDAILKLAYIRDPKLFDRDAQTRRSKSRADLKQQTGWTDEQIEGWRIMLERNPKKDRILEKREFSGNRIMAPIAGGSGDQPSAVQRGGGRGRGRARGRGRGSGGKSGVGEKKDEVVRERAFKEKHKSSTRRRGHDKKMARTGGGPPT